MDFFATRRRRPRGANNLAASSRASSCTPAGHWARPKLQAKSSSAPQFEKRDIIATATALTARSVALAIERFVLPKGDFGEMIISGGGARNPTLVAWLTNAVRRLGLGLRSSEEFGIPSSAKEAVAFAVMAYETWNRRPSNVPCGHRGRTGGGAGEDFVSVKSF